MVPLWKFYAPFISVAFILFGKYFYAMEGMIYHHVFPVSKGGLVGGIFMLLMGTFFVLFMARRYYWRESLDEKWYDIEYGIGVGIWLSLMPALFLMNACLAFVLWINSLYATPSCEKSYQLRHVEISEQRHHTPARYSASGFFHSFPYAELVVGSADAPSDVKYAYCDAVNGMPLAGTDGVVLLVRQRTGWLGIGIVESIKVDFSRARERTGRKEDVQAEDSTSQKSPIYKRREAQTAKRLQELLDELEQKNRQDSIAGDSVK